MKDVRRHHNEALDRMKEQSDALLHALNYQKSRGEADEDAVSQVCFCLSSVPVHMTQHLLVLHACKTHAGKQMRMRCLRCVCVSERLTVHTDKLTFQMHLHS